MIDQLLNIVTHRLLRVASFLGHNKWVLFMILATTATILYFYMFSLGFALFMTALLALVCYSVEWGAYFLMFFLPAKYLLKQEFLTTYQTSLVVPFVLLFTVFIVLSQDSEHEVVSTDKYFFLMFFASFFSVTGALLLYGPRTAVLLDFFVWLQLVGFYMLGRFVLKGEKIFIFMRRNLILANVISFFAIMQIFFQKQGYSQWIDSFESISFRATSLTGNPNALAGYLMMMILVGVVLLVKSDKNKQLIAFLSLIIPAIGLLLTYSRGAIISLIFGVVLILIKGRKWHWLFFSAALVSLIIFPSGLGERFRNGISHKGIEYSQDSGRIWALNNVFYINKKHFLFGSGWGSYGGEYAYRPLSPTYLEGLSGGSVAIPNTDNQWLQVYAQQGIIGLWLYALMVWGILKKQKNSPFIPVMFSFLVWGFFVDSFQFYQASFFGFLLLGHLASGKSKTVVE